LLATFVLAVTCVSYIYLHGITSMPDRLEAIDIATAKSEKFIDERCRPPHEYETQSHVILKTDKWYHVRTDVRLPSRAFIIDTLVHPDLRVGIFRMHNVEVIGHNVNCGG